MLKGSTSAIKVEATIPMKLSKEFFSFYLD